VGGFKPGLDLLDVESGLKIVVGSEYLLGVNATDGGADVRGIRDEGTNTSRTHAPGGASSNTSRPSSRIL